MDSRGWIGLIWLAIGVGLLPYTIVSRRGRTDSDREASEEPGGACSLKRLAIPLILVLSGMGITRWGSGAFDPEPTDDRRCPGPQ